MVGALDVNLVGGHQRHAAPRQKRVAEDRSCRRWHAAKRALASECRDGARMSQEERRLLPDFGQQFVEIVGRGGACPGLDALLGGNAVQESVVGIVEQFPLLALFHVLNQKAKLLRSLFVRFAEKIRDARVNVKHRVDGAQFVFLRVLFILDIRFRQGAFVDLAARDIDRFALVDAVAAKRAGFERLPVQQTNQPARCDGSILRGGLGDVGQLKRSLFAQSLMRDVFFSHEGCLL